MVARRVTASGFALFAVLVGAETAFAEEALTPRAAPVSTVHEKCPSLFGVRLSALGPNSAATIAGVTQPGVCWLEVSLGLGFGYGELSAVDSYVYSEDTTETEAEGRYFSFTMPLGARVWFMNEHSLLADAGFGFTRYLMSADINTQGYPIGTWKLLSTSLIAHLGIGYGYRAEGAQSAPRVTVVVGALVHLTDLGDSSVTYKPRYGDEGLQRALDNEADDLTDLEPYGEISIAWM